VIEVWAATDFPDGSGSYTATVFSSNWTGLR
jgi:hypothetical protein